MLKEFYHKSPEPVKSTIKRVHSKIPLLYVYRLKINYVFTDKTKHVEHKFVFSGVARDYLVWMDINGKML